MCWFLSVHSPFTLLPRTCILVTYLTVRTSRGIISKFPYLNIFRVPHTLTSLSGYQYPKVYPSVSYLTTDTTKPIGSQFYLSRLSPQGLTHISFILSNDRVRFFTNGGTVPLLITRGTPCLHRSITVVETPKLLQVKIILEFRVPLSDDFSEPLPRLTRRRNVWSEIQSSHLNLMGLSK